MGIINYNEIKHSFTEIRNEIIRVIGYSNMNLTEVNDLIKLKEDIGLNEFEISNICFKINLQHNLKFSWKEIQDFKTIGELTFFYYKRINNVII